LTKYFRKFDRYDPTDLEEIPKNVSMKKQHLITSLSLVFAGMFLFYSSCQQKSGGDIIVEAYFTITPKIGTTATEFVFDASGTTYIGNPEGEKEYDWDFGDGTKAVVVNGEKIEKHKYSAAGTYNVQLIVTARNMDNRRFEGRYNDYVIVEDPSSGEPTAVLTVEPSQGTVGTSFLFDASGSYDALTPDDQLEVRWDWNGDGLWDVPYSTLKQMTHQYSFSGTYEVRIEVKDEEELTDIAWVTVEVTGQGPEPCPGVPYVDYLGKRYNTVQIGPQCWLRENLDVGTMIPGDQQQTDNGEIEKYCYDNDPANCEIFGGLYQWKEMMAYSMKSNQGICPPGWHIPNEQNEWADLIINLGGSDVAGGLMKGLAYWTAPNTGATNATGFTGLPGGKVDPWENHFSEIFNEAHFWAAEWSVIGSMPEGVKLVYDQASILESDGWMWEGYSVRCIMDQK
jgi:uncharacterized protein (TIGR02145 family)